MTKQEAARLVILSHIATLQSWLMQGPQGINAAANFIANLLGIEALTVEQIREKWAHLFELTEEEKAKNVAQAIPVTGKAPVMGFPTMEAFMKHLQQVSEQEKAQPLADWQHNMKTGDCFLQRASFGDVPVDIYGVILKLEEGEDAELFEKMKDHRLCRCYSRVCPEGEVGSVHVGSFHEKLSPSIFKEMVDSLHGRCTD